MACIYAPKEWKPLLSQARLAFRRGARIAAMTKCAVDEKAIAYWSDYFKQYGMQWVRPLAARQVVAKRAQSADVKREMDEKIEAEMAASGSTRPEAAAKLLAQQEGWYKQTPEGEMLVAVAAGKEASEEPTKEAQYVPRGTLMHVKGETLKVLDVTESAGVFNYHMEKQDGSVVDMTDQQLAELDATMEEKIASRRTAQFTFDCALRVIARDWVELAPDAFEHALKFALGALKPSDALHISAEHVFADVENPLQESEVLAGYANATLTLPSEEVSPEMLATLKSQLGKFMEEADFPLETIEVVSIQKRASQDEKPCIMDAARRGMSLAKLVAHYGFGQAKLAAACAEKERRTEAMWVPAYVRLAAMHLEAQAAPDVEFTGDATMEEGAKADLGDGMMGHIVYEGTALPTAFHWQIVSSDGAVLGEGDAENQDEAEGQVRVEYQKALGKVQKEKAAQKIAILKAVGPFTEIEKMASLGEFSEYRVETQGGQTVWLKLTGSRVDSKISF